MIDTVQAERLTPTTMEMRRYLDEEIGRVLSAATWEL
jgi:hypothetical protein